MIRRARSVARVRWKKCVQNFYWESCRKDIMCEKEVWMGMYLKRKLSVLDWTELAQSRGLWRSVVNFIMFYSGEFIDKPRDRWCSKNSAMPVGRRQPVVSFDYGTKQTVIRRGASVIQTAEQTCLVSTLPPAISSLMSKAANIRFHGVMVSTLDFESSDPSSNLGGTCILQFYIVFIMCLCLSWGKVSWILLLSCTFVWVGTCFWKT